MTPALRRRVAELAVVRDFPWRRTRDPWLVLVAELCCQQTQAARAVAAYERCIAAFPTPATCAAAPLRDVLEAWRGLGYYRRARALHDAAKAIVAEHGGQVPGDLDALLALPGVGPYTARAVLCFAFERDEAVVDTNVARVLADELCWISSTDTGNHPGGDHEVVTADVVDLDAAERLPLVFHRGRYSGI